MLVSLARLFRNAYTLAGGILFAFQFLSLCFYWSICGKSSAIGVPHFCVGFPLDHAPLSNEGHFFRRWLTLDFPPVAADFL